MNHIPTMTANKVTKTRGVQFAFDLVTGNSGGKQMKTLMTVTRIGDKKLQT